MCFRCTEESTCFVFFLIRVSNFVNMPNFVTNSLGYIQVETFDLSKDSIF